MPSSLIPVTTASWLAGQVHTNPESVYDIIKKAEEWIKELKETARQAIIKRMPVGAKSLDLETDGYVVNCKKNSGKAKPAAIREMLMLSGLDPKKVVYPLPVEYDILPNGKETLAFMLAEKVLTQEQYDSCFTASNHTVSIKAKSSKTIDLNTYEG